MKAIPNTTDAYNLLHQGTLVMAEMERNGICVDIDYLNKTLDETKEQISNLTKNLLESEIGRKWKKKYGSSTKFSSRDQLADILFKEMGFESDRKTATRVAADAEALEDINDPFVKDYVLLERLKKAKSTCLENFRRETVNGIMHPNFGLNFARTFRGQSDHPNFTNIPVRDPLIKKMVRTAIIPRKGNSIIDLDFKGSEINGASWYHKDPTMLKYIKTNPGQLHTDMAAQCYMLDLSQVSKDARYCGKNKFVFPQFYGDWWLSCAKQLWVHIDRMNLKTNDGVPLKKWLRSKGIKSLGTGDPNNVKPNSFEAHIKKVEEHFWNKRFKVYKQWKEDWWEEYQDKGYFQMLSGFVVFGELNRKDCINYPIQGTAFHCLLWSLIEISKRLRKYKMKTKLIGQIHDDVVSDTPENEIKDYIDIALEVIEVDLRKHWSFIITPVATEVEITPINGSWYEKQEYVK